MVASNSLRTCGVPDSAADLICDLGQVITRSRFRKRPQSRRPDFRQLGLDFVELPGMRSHSEFQCKEWVPQIRLKVSDPKPFEPLKLTLTLWGLCSNAFDYSQWVYDRGGVLRTLHEQYKYEKCNFCCAFLYYCSEYKLTISAGHLVHSTGFGILLRHFELGAWLPGVGFSESQASLPKMNPTPSCDLCGLKRSPWGTCLPMWVTQLPGRDALKT